MGHDQEIDRGTVRRAQDGDRAAYGALVHHYQDRVYRYVLRLTGSHDEALELTQEAFIKAWEALPVWRPEAQFHTWLFRIASNAAMDTLRRRKVVDFVPLPEDYDAPAETPSPEAQLDTKQQLRALDAALARLTPEQREMILLREVEGLSYEEISAALGIHEGTVKSRLARARVALVAAYGGKGT